jgi:transcriptional regulator with XRE-family HTH domain
MNDTQRSLAEKLDRLFEEKRKPDGSQYTQADVVEGTQGVLTRVYLWKLRTGRASNPGFQILQAISDFFGVDPSYFFEDRLEEAVDESLRVRNDLLNKITLRSSMLDEEGKQAVLNMIDYILKSKDR